MSERHVCVSLTGASFPAIEHCIQNLPPEVSHLELRADGLSPQAFSSEEAWSLPSRFPRFEWIFTWRSPGQGGLSGACPETLWSRALGADYRWIDIEVGENVDDVPESQRWMSWHPQEAPKTRAELIAMWGELVAVPAGFRKLVVRTPDLEINRWLLDLVTEESGNHQNLSIFGQDPAGLYSRFVGGLKGNAVTFAGTRALGGTAPGQPTVEDLTAYGFFRCSENAAVYGVVGSQALESLSPKLHNPALERCGIDATYLPFQVSRFDEVPSWLESGFLRGVSVTQPFKEDAYAAVHEPTANLQTLGAVNTLWFDGEIRGENTDALASAAWLAPAGNTVAVLGAGGAARGAVGAAKQLGKTITVFNRSESRGKELAKDFGVSFGGLLSAFDPESFEVIIQTAAQVSLESLMSGALETTWSGKLQLDLLYGVGESHRREHWEKGGGIYVSGREFLVRQGHLQFQQWTGKEITLESFGEGLSS